MWLPFDIKLHLSFESHGASMPVSMRHCSGQESFVTCGVAVAAEGALLA
jgi:hypothetical protein